MGRRYVKRIVAGCVMVLAAATAACGGGQDSLSPLTSESSVFAGLNPKVVQEVLDNPVASGKIAEETEETNRDSLAQGIVVNFITCREVAHAYQEWVTTGTAPTLAPGAVPDDPLAWYEYEPANRERLKSAMSSGDPARLRPYLVEESSCGNWIPAKPGDVSGPTIREAIESLG